MASGTKKRPPDLGGGQACEGAQRQCDLRFHHERGVTAGEDQPQPVVVDSALGRAGNVVGRVA